MGGSRRDLAAISAAVPVPRALAAAGTWLWPTYMIIPNNATSSQLSSINAGLAALTATAGPPASAFASVVSALAAAGAPGATALAVVAVVNNVTCGANAAAACNVGGGSSSSSLSGGAIAGIVIGSVAFVALVAVAAVCFVRRKSAAEKSGLAARRRRNPRGLRHLEPLLSAPAELTTITHVARLAPPLASAPSP